ncbi:retrovirus-related pol polyprotein from transposon TNT 1-94, partial [Tanacetum coccineum]
MAQPRMNLVQNVRNLVVQNAVQNLGVQNVRNKNRLNFVLGIANSNVNQIGNGNVVAARAKGNGNGNNRNQIRCYNYRGLGHFARNCTVRPRKRDVVYVRTQLLIAQKEEQASTSGTQIDKAPVYDLNGSAEWGNILITGVYFVEALGYNLFSVGQFYDSDLEVPLRRNNYFVKNLEGVDFLKGNHTTNLYTINLHEMASASSICLMARATSTKS